MWIVAVLIGLAAVAAAAAWYWLRTDFEVDNPIDLQRLKATLDSVGVSEGATQIPDPALLASYISMDDDFLDAVPAQRGGKRAVLVALGDRVVAVEATAGQMGAEVHVLPYDAIDSFQQSFEIGGDVTFGVDGGEIRFTHIPRSQTRDFAAALRERLDA